MPSIILVGTQWGDEGKGKISDTLSAKAQHIIRSQGGNNAGHTVIVEKEEYKLHLIPVGILHPHSQCYIGAGTVIDPKILLHEISHLEQRGISISGRLWISPRAHVIFPYHKICDFFLEKRKGNQSIGTTGRGIGPCYADKANRLGIRIQELMNPELFYDALKSNIELKNEELTKIFGEEPLSFEEIFKEYIGYGSSLAPYVADVEQQINDAIDRNENVLFEGAQGTYLDLTLGTYPFVTASSTVAGGICAGVGVGPKKIDHIIGVAKAFVTRVGNGPFPTELQEGETFPSHSQAREFGTTTGRKRRIGWFDAVLARDAIKMNSVDSLALTKLDVFDHLEQIKICTHYQIAGAEYHGFPHLYDNLQKIVPVYKVVPGWQKSTEFINRREDLPDNAKKYLDLIEELCEIPISILSVGPKREQTCFFQDLFVTMEAKNDCIK